MAQEPGPQALEGGAVASRASVLRLREEQPPGGQGPHHPCRSPQRPVRGLARAPAPVGRASPAGQTPRPPHGTEACECGCLCRFPEAPLNEHEARDPEREGQLRGCVCLLRPHSKGPSRGRWGLQTCLVPQLRPESQLSALRNSEKVPPASAPVCMQLLPSLSPHLPASLLGGH